MFGIKKYPDELYANLILANLQTPLKKDGTTVIRPKFLTGIAHRLGGAESWKQLEENATFAGYTAEEKEKLREGCIPEFKKILENYSMSKVSNLCLNLFLKAGWRDRKKSGIVVESLQRKIDKESIVNVLNTKGIYLDTIYVYFGKDFHEVTSYAPFSYRSEGAAYFMRIEGWKNTKSARTDLVDILKKENRI